MGRKSLHITLTVMSAVAFPLRGTGCGWLGIWKTNWVGIFVNVDMIQMMGCRLEQEHAVQNSRHKMAGTY